MWTQHKLQPGSSAVPPLGDCPPDYDIHCDSSFQDTVYIWRIGGFIFYAQILDALFLDVIDKSRATSQWSLTLKWAFLLTYRVPNLNFFTFDSLSFCLLKGATTLDIVAFKYTTVVCAFILVLATYVIMNTCNVYKCHKCCKFYTRLQAQTSVIHGISTFLVMCFAQLVCSNIIPPANSRPYLWQRGHNSSIKVTVSWRHYFV